MQRLKWLIKIAVYFIFLSLKSVLKDLRYKNKCEEILSPCKKAIIAFTMDKASYGIFNLEEE